MSQDGISNVSAVSDLDDNPISPRPTLERGASSHVIVADEQDAKMVRDDELLFEEDQAVPSSSFVPERYRVPGQQVAGDGMTRARRPSRPPPIPPPFPAEPTTAVFSRVGAARAMNAPPPPAAGSSNARQRELMSQPVSTPYAHSRHWPPEDRASPQSQHAVEHHDPLDSGWTSEPERGFDDNTLVGYPASADQRARLDSSSYAGGVRSVEPPRTHPTRAEHKVPTDNLREGDVLLGRYRVIHVIEDGPVLTADVVRLALGSAAQAVLMKADAIGAMSAHEHFTRTARTVAQLQSEHLARILDLSAARSRVAYVVFERSGVGDLAELMRTRGALSVSDALDFTTQLADALAEAHANGICHGSLRPARVFVNEGADGSPLLKIAGFGVLAQWSLVSMPSSLQFGGGGHDTVHYLAPEQIRVPNLVDPRSDIWALGLLLYEMLLGVPVYAGPSSAATLAMIAADPAPSIVAARPDVPRALESVVMRCLEKRPEARYATVAELVRALKPFVSSETQARIERIVRIGARSARATSTFMPPGDALVHVPTHDVFGAAEPANPVPKDQVSRTTTTWHLGALLLLVLGTSGVAGVIGAVLTARTWPRQATAGAPALQRQPPPPAEVPVTPQQPSEELERKPQVARAPAASANLLSAIARPGVVEAPARTRTPAQNSPNRLPFAKALVKQPRALSPVDQTDAKPETPNRDHLFDDIQ